MPQPSPGTKPLARRSNGAISVGDRAPAFAKPTSSKGSRMISTPPAMARSRSPSASRLHADEIATSDEAHAPSTAKAPP